MAPSRGAPDALLVLSPHPDDGPLSCGGRLARAARAGERAGILTIFAGSEPVTNLSPLAERLHRLFGLREDVVAHRRDEDRSSAAALGAHIEHWDLLEGIYRSDPDSQRPLYPGLDALFGPLHPFDEPLIGVVARRLAELPHAALVLAPLAAGGHVDHILVRRAAERAFGSRLAYYEDYPYAERRGAVRKALHRQEPDPREPDPRELDPRELGNRGEWREEVAELEPGVLDRKVEAIAAHRSQMRALFKLAFLMPIRVRRYARKVGGERIWRRETP